MQWQIGKVKITRVVELVVSGDNEFVLPDAQNEKCLAYDWMQPHFMDEKGFLLFSVHGLIVDTGAHRVMVDTCIGNDKQLAVPSWNNMQTNFLEDMNNAGYARGDIDTVLCTHLHVDHVGWNTMLVDGKWVPTFSNARYLVAKSEWEHWDAHEEEIEIGPVMQQSVRPIVEAGLMELVDHDYRVCPEIRLIPTPGHTPGHVSVLISSEDSQALITGDFIHHPVQMSRPDWCSSADSDPARGLLTRKEILERYAGTDVLVIGSHFPTPSAGYVRQMSDGDNYRLDVSK